MGEGPHTRPQWGPQPLANGTTRFALWAPDQPTLSLRTPSGDLPMQAADGGWFTIDTTAVAPGEGYGFVLPDGFCVPDPAARAQMGNVHGFSKLVDHGAYQWQTDWQGRPWHETVIMELHIGTFTPGGTYRAAIDKLDHLVAAGVTAIELLPLAQFGGNRGWGYDGVLLYAPHNAYGSTDDLKALIDAAHARGLVVFLDVVYNHFGPDGNYLGKYASRFFDADRHTPWGAAIAFDEPAVRDFFIANPLYWLSEFRFDGLRFDAIDHIRDPSERHILVEMASAIRNRFDRPVHLHTEDERNVIFLHPYENGAPTLFTGEWNDDYHNVIHPIATGESEGYYGDFVDNRWGTLARALTEGFIFQGEPSKIHDNTPRGVPSAGQPLTAFVIFNQNHDQVGNRAFGDRLISLTTREMLAALTAVHLLAPQIPLLWMGEEWGETNPFCFFTDFDGDLAAAVRKGRRNEFAKFDAFVDPDTREDIPDPNDMATFAMSRIDWTKPQTPEGAQWLALYSGLLKARADHIVPRLKDIAPHAGRIIEAADGVVRVAWTMGDGATTTMLFNASDSAVPLPAGQLIAAVEAGALTNAPTGAPLSTVVTLS